MRKVNILLSLMLGLALFQAKAQQVRPGLAPLAEEFREAAEQQEKAIQDYVDKTGMPRTRVTPDGTVFSIYAMKDGQPVFIKSHNARAANTINASSLYEGAAMGLDLSGEGMTLGIWEAGGVVRKTHRELTGRVENLDASEQTDHATHVAGTMIASGVSPEAKGMAYKARLRSYDVSADNSEMTQEAANGMLISNHSYGFLLGWDDSNGGWNWNGNEDISKKEDYRFGLYASFSRAWDNIAYNAPYYLIVKSAGNDRGNSGDGSYPPDGPYDIIGTRGVAKNILTVAAVRGLSKPYSKPSDVVMSGFSSWGPADDGRIKPDISACGVNVVSSNAGADDDYGSSSGTSMAAPNASGGLALLQELYAKQNEGEYMKSATLKGLVIHTANEAGEADGPDYMFGWGLMDVQKAAQAILNRSSGRGAAIEELELLDGQEILAEFEAEKDAPITATICWTDLPGEVRAPTLDPDTLNLINDLDLRIIDENGNEFLPWILDPSNVEAAATKGDNIRDNVEKVEFIAPSSGTYTVKVSHKDTLVNTSEGARQEFSIILTTSNRVPPAYYWVGGSGSWNDTTHWSNTSGGASAGSIPSLGSVVVFDENSMLGPDSVVTILETASCERLVFNESTAGTVQIAEDASLEVAGNVTILGNLYFDGTVVLTGQQAYSIVNAYNTQFSELEMYSEVAGATWVISDTLRANSLWIENGFLLGDKAVVEAEDFYAGANAGLGIGEFDLHAEFAFLDDGATIESDLFRVNLTSEGDVSFHSTAMIDELQMNGASGILSGGASFKTASLNVGDLMVFDNQRFNVLNLLPATFLTLEEGSTQFIDEEFNAQGAEGSLITLTGEGSGAALETASARIKHCADYLSVNNVQAKGGASFSAGENSTLTGNTDGWFELDCEDVPFFVNFRSEYFCQNAFTFFTDMSSGNMLAWEWDFGNPALGEENTSQLQNPRVVYADTGSYTVTLTVTFADDVKKSVSEAITIEESNATIPGISVEGDILSSTIGASNYQWLLDGELISGANNFSYQATSPGVYTLWTWNNSDGCRYESEPLEYGLATALESSSLSRSLVVAPNPSQGVFNLQLNLGTKMVNQYTITVYDMLGRVVERQEGESRRNSLNDTVDLSTERSGHYLIHLKTNEGVAVKRVVKQ